MHYNPQLTVSVLMLMQSYDLSIVLVLTQLHGLCSVAFILQSTAFSCAHLESRCEAFLQQFQTSLEQMTEESFKTQVGRDRCRGLSFR